MRMTTVALLVGALALSALGFWAPKAVAQITDPALRGIWKGIVQCQGGKSAYAFLQVQNRGFAEGGLTGRLSFDTTGAKLTAWSRDGVSFQAERNAINHGVSSFRLARISAEEIQLQTSGGYCQTRGALRRDREDVVEDIYSFRAGGPQEWAGKSPLVVINGSNFFSSISKIGANQRDPTFLAESARLQSACSFSDVRVTPYGVVNQAFLMNVLTRYAVAGVSGRCNDGSEVAVYAPSAGPLWLSRELNFDTPRLCESRPESTTFKACGFIGGAYKCVAAPKPFTGFSCNRDLLEVHPEVGLVFARSTPPRCETPTYETCDRSPTGSLFNCRSSVGATSCSGGPDTPRGPPLERLPAKIGTWSGATGATAVVDMPGIGGRAGNCPTTFEARRGRGQALRCYCPASEARLPIWGGQNGVYKDTSDICSAALHAGVLQSEGAVIVSPTPGLSSYAAMDRAGWRSFSSRGSEHAYTISALP